MKTYLLPLSLPPPAWHADARSERPQIFNMLREATDRQVLDLLELQRRFIDGIESDRLMWVDGGFVRDAAGNYRRLWLQGLGRMMSDAEEEETKKNARSVEYWIRGEILDRFRESVEKRESKVRMAAWRRKEKRKAGTA